MTSAVEVTQMDMQIHLSLNTVDIDLRWIPAGENWSASFGELYLF